VAASPLDARERAKIAKLRDPVERALAAHRLIDAYQAEITELAALRRDALHELLASGKTQAQVADLLGMSRARISQVLAGTSKPERAFLGNGRLTVAIGGKQEVGRSDPGDVVSVESFAAFELLAQLSRSLGLDAEYEVVPPPGHVRLNRPNLIVLTNPRLLPFLGQVMEADPRLRFEADDQGWYMVDIESSEEFRSPRDRGVNADFAYVGRLPRPDGKGTFLYLAGTHAQGTLGAAHYVAAQISSLYRDLKNRRFSLVVRCTFDPKKPREITSIEPVTPVYRHEA
jgi:hypothetical protein